jgi:hypothetical protein
MYKSKLVRNEFCPRLITISLSESHSKYAVSLLLLLSILSNLHFKRLRIKMGTFPNKKKNHKLIIFYNTYTLLLT